mmetsp:Transcript_5372/g.14471  ORF Transcript_5372/g.14471 Transcript_5372/m.14471 type:complete len:102 (+) Transcript_5372:1633-1938(+)
MVRCYMTTHTHKKRSYKDQMLWGSSSDIETCLFLSSRCSTSRCELDKPGAKFPCSIRHGDGCAWSKQEQAGATFQVRHFFPLQQFCLLQNKQAGSRDAANN